MIFPEDYDTQNDYEDADEGTELPELADWAIDMSTDPWTLAKKDGRPYMIYGEDAVRQWIEKTIITARGRYAYNLDYGSELDSILPMTDADAMGDAIKAAIVDALESDYIIGVKDFSYERDDDDAYTVRFTVETIYGEVAMENVGI